MVRLNATTWITATTYGSVFTHISDDQNLIRVYLDNEATEKLCSDCFDFIIEQVKKKQVDVSGFSQFQKLFCNEKNRCDHFASQNNWELFSLHPMQFSVQTLNYCNARCDFCYANAPNVADRKLMDFSLLCNLKDYAADQGIKFGVSGGEPLLHPDIYEILSYRNDEVFDTLITNLTAPVDVDKLMKTKVDLIQVSLHGFDIFHDQTLNIKGAYRKIFKRIRMLFPSIHMATNTVITPQNIESIPRLVQDFQDVQQHVDRSFSYVRFVPVVPSGTGLATYQVEETFFDEAEELLRSLQKEYSDLNFEIPLIHANLYEYKKMGNRWMCPAGSTVAVVRLDGHLVPCNQFLDTAITSMQKITESSFERIWWYDPLFSSLRKGVAATNNQRCDECMYLMMKDQHKL